MLALRPAIISTQPWHSPGLLFGGEACFLIATPGNKCNEPVVLRRTEADAHRYLEAVREKQPITIGGYVTDDSLRPHTGVVEYVQDCGESKGRWRWLVSMSEVDDWARELGGIA